uniref:Uncharacterized protein n=1 Tax=Arundo donax TaxID=35708 RepID=A0A0A9GLT1_ARUDO
MPTNQLYMHAHKTNRGPRPNSAKACLTAIALFLQSSI